MSATQKGRRLLCPVPSSFLKGSGEAGSRLPASKSRNLSGPQPPAQATGVDLLPGPAGQKEPGDDGPSLEGDAGDHLL